VEKMDFTGVNKRFVRLSDRILFALEMALDQRDLAIAESLARTLELAMTRNTGGGEFVERRDYPSEIEMAMARLSELKLSVRGSARL
jgi:hypothetical protein